MLEVFKRAEVTKGWELMELFGDVYGGEEPWNLVSHVRQRQDTETNVTIIQKEQREELAGLLRKYGKDWEPWRNELEKFRGKGKELTEG